MNDLDGSVSPPLSLSLSLADKKGTSKQVNTYQVLRRGESKERRNRAFPQFCNLSSSDAQMRWGRRKEGRTSETNKIQSRSDAKKIQFSCTIHFFYKKLPFSFSPPPPQKKWGRRRQSNWCFLLGVVVEVPSIYPSPFPLPSSSSSSSSRLSGMLIPAPFSKKKKFPTPAKNGGGGMVVEPFRHADCLPTRRGGGGRGGAACLFRDTAALQKEEAWIQRGLVIGGGEETDSVTIP